MEQPPVSYYSPVPGGTDSQYLSSTQVPHAVLGMTFQWQAKDYTRQCACVSVYVCSMHECMLGFYDDT